MGKLWRTVLLSVLLGGASASASACPVCGTRTGQQVRQGIFESRFAADVFLTLLPFPILLGIVLALHFGFPAAARPKPRSAAAGPIPTSEDA